MSKRIMCSAMKVRAKMKAIAGYVNIKACAVIAGVSACLTTLAEEAGLDAYCIENFNPNGTVNNFMKTLFNFIFLAGIIFTGLGIVTLIRAALQTAGGDQVQPGAVIKGFSSFAIGVILMGLRSIIKSISGVDPISLSLF